MFTPRTKPITTYYDTFKPYNNPMWDDLDTITWDQMEYMWDFFNSLATYLDRTKPNTTFTNI